MPEYHINPNLYACLPPDKKEEYKKLFPEPVIDYAMPTISVEDCVLSEYAFLGDRVIKHKGVGAIACIPPKCIPGPLTCATYIDNYIPHIECRTSEPEIGLSHGEQRLIKKGVVKR